MTKRDAFIKEFRSLIGNPYLNIDCNDADCFIDYGTLSDVKDQKALKALITAHHFNEADKGVVVWFGANEEV